MSEKEQIEVVETTELTEVTEKTGVVTKVKNGVKKHKKGIIIGLLTITAVVFGLKKFGNKSNGSDCDCEGESDEYVDSYAEEVEMTIE